MEHPVFPVPSAPHFPKNQRKAVPVRPLLPFCGSGSLTAAGQTGRHPGAFVPGWLSAVSPVPPFGAYPPPFGSANRSRLCKRKACHTPWCRLHSHTVWVSGTASRLSSQTAGRPPAPDYQAWCEPASSRQRIPPPDKDAVLWLHSGKRNPHHGRG